jgi:hypothetical protein
MIHLCRLILLVAVYELSVSAWCLPRLHSLPPHANPSRSRPRDIATLRALGTNKDNDPTTKFYVMSSANVTPERDSARFRLGEQSLSDWTLFTVTVSAVLGVEYYIWLYNRGPQLGYHLVDAISAFSSGNSMLTFAVLFATFGVFHSGLAALRPTAEEIIGARAWRYAFALTSLPLAFSCMIYFLNHRLEEALACCCVSALFLTRESHHPIPGTMAHSSGSCRACRVFKPWCG